MASSSASLVLGLVVHLMWTCLLIIPLFTSGRAFEFCRDYAPSYEEARLAPYSCPSYCCEDFTPRYTIYCCTDCSKSLVTRDCPTSMGAAAIVGACLAAATSFLVIACVTAVACYKCRAVHRERQQRLRDQARLSHMGISPGHPERLHSSAIMDPALGGDVRVGRSGGRGHSVRLVLDETPPFSLRPPAYSDVMEPPPPYTSVERHHGGYVNYAGPDATSGIYI